MDLYLDWLCQSSQVEYAENEAKQLLNRFRANLRTPNFEPGRTFFSSQRFQVMPSANGIIWKQLLEKKVRVGLRFGARLALPSSADISLGACYQSCLVSFSEYCLPA